MWWHFFHMPEINIIWNVQNTHTHNIIIHKTDFLGEIELQVVTGYTFDMLGENSTMYRLKQVIWMYYSRWILIPSLKSLKLKWWQTISRTVQIPQWMCGTGAAESQRGWVFSAVFPEPESSARLNHASVGTQSAPAQPWPDHIRLSAPGGRSLSAPGDLHTEIRNPTQINTIINSHN